MNNELERAWKETSGPEVRYHPVISLAVPRLEPVISRIVISIFSGSVSLLSRRNEICNQKQYGSSSKNNNDHNDSGDVDDADQKQDGGKIVRGTS